MQTRLFVETDIHVHRWRKASLRGSEMRLTLETNAIVGGDERFQRLRLILLIRETNSLKRAFVIPFY